MTISILKIHFQKLPPKIIKYKDFKKFGNESFMIFLQYTLSEELKNKLITSKTWTHFVKFFIVFLTITHPEKKYVRENNKPFMTKAYPRAITQRTGSSNNFVKNHAKERNYFIIHYKTLRFFVFFFWERKRNILHKWMGKMSLIIENFGKLLNLSFG